MSKSFNVDLVAGKALLYDKRRTKIKDLNEEQQILSNELKALAEANGEKVDEKGSRSIAAGPFKISSMVRRSTKIKQDEAIKILKKHKLYDEIVEEVTAYEFDESAIEQAFLSGELSKEEIAEMTDINDTRAVEVKRVNA